MHSWSLKNHGTSQPHVGPTATQSCQHRCGHSLQDACLNHADTVNPNSTILCRCCFDRGDITCGAPRTTNEKGGHATESSKSPELNWNIQDVDIIGRLKLDVDSGRFGGGGGGGGGNNDYKIKPVMIGNSPAWQIGELKGDM